MIYEEKKKKKSPYRPIGGSCREIRNLESESEREKKGGESLWSL